MAGEHTEPLGGDVVPDTETFTDKVDPVEPAAAPEPPKFAHSIMVLGDGETEEQAEVRLVQSWLKKGAEFTVLLTPAGKLLMTAQPHGGKPDHVVINTPHARTATYKVLAYKPYAPSKPAEPGTNDHPPLAAEPAKGNDYVKLDDTTLFH